MKNVFALIGEQVNHYPAIMVGLLLLVNLITLARVREIQEEVQHMECIAPKTENK